MMKARDVPIRYSREIAVGVKTIRGKTAFENKWLKEPDWMQNTNHSYDESSHYD